MAKKPAVKAPPVTPPDRPRRSLTPMLVGAVAIVVAIGAFAYMRVDRSEAEQRTTPDDASTSSQPPPPPRLAPLPGPPVNARFGPHTQANLPPFPFTGFPPVRPVEVVGAVYKFAAEHPEVLGYVPCYCGCERSGHRGNDDCFVARREANGDVTEWEPHGMT